MIFDYHKRYKDVYPQCLEESELESQHILTFYSNTGKLLCLYSNTTCKHTVVTDFSVLNETENIKYLGFGSIFPINFLHRH